MTFKSSGQSTDTAASNASVAPFIVLMTSLAMIAFAANSLLTRAAFQTTDIDAASFSGIRVISGALTLLIIFLAQGGKIKQLKAEWWAAVFLFTYVAAFSFAYRDISTGAGALILFASAQVLMISCGLRRGERTSIFGLFVALGGMIAFLAPSASAPPAYAAALMAVAGIAWGAFSVAGKANESPLVKTASSFLGAIPFAVVLVLYQHDHLRVDTTGAWYAVIAGGLTSAVGYAIWYWARVRMTTITAGAVQLSVPILSMVLGVLILSEDITMLSGISALVTLSGVAWVSLTTRQKKL
ncbi:DMT family transporter [Pseudomonas alliivorans]|nr:DMT family transporter [Pseudomonas alliivorans]MEE4963950.1 DMT family transporter [Pseudomonas alliivorans]MEE4970353.1 DMT family transporter [Pseudomonas alliivorans]MEE4975888.1 DMT family transporter [Pseudomonas alliivorans]MEE4980987.1 DMT family transporter [Pseudomonas alliivorans]